MRVRETNKTTGAIREYLAEIGRKGGSAATGAKKRRSPDHYKKMVAARRKKRKAKAKQAKADE
jgi:hypothetical protein